jgi:hypothetical protein
MFGRRINKTPVAFKRNPAMMGVSPKPPKSPAPVNTSPSVKTPAFDAMAELAMKKAKTPIPSGSDANIPYMPGPGAPTLVPDVKSRASIEVGPDGMPKITGEAPYRQGTDRTAFKKGGKVSSASKRGDGIASKGKTKGRMI